jgi:hypothetical protein
MEDEAEEIKQIEEIRQKFQEITSHLEAANKSIVAVTHMLEIYGYGLNLREMTEMSEALGQSITTLSAMRDEY